VTSTLTKQEKKQIRKNLLGNKKETPIEEQQEGSQIPENKKRESDT
jgi:hypothetical protein